jgi:hypothetical protein
VSSSEHDEYKPSFIELHLNSNMDPYNILTRFLHKLFGINSEAIKFKIKIEDQHGLAACSKLMLCSETQHKK